MKKLSTIILLALMASLLVNVSTGCTTTPPDKPQDTTTNDTTPNTPDKTNGFKIGTDGEYALELNASLSFGEYNSTTERTYIQVYGIDLTRPNLEQEANFTLEFDSMGVGSFNMLDFNARMDIGTGSGVKREEFTSDGEACTVVVTEYGDVGERIKGTFSGKVKKGTNTLSVQGGYFDVERR